MSQRETPPAPVPLQLAIVDRIMNPRTRMAAAAEHDDRTLLTELRAALARFESAVARGDARADVEGCDCNYCTGLRLLRQILALPAPAAPPT